MSKSDATVSSEEQGAAAPDSVFDFLYHDSRRIASFLSQFDDNGHLTGLTQGESLAKGSRRSKKFGVGGDVALLGGGKLEFELGPGEVGGQTLERVYDPFWTNARLFLDALTERDLIQRDIGAAEVGQFVLAKGWLSVLDLAMFKDAWKLPTVQRKVREGATPAKKASLMTAGERKAHQEQKDNTDMMLEMIQIMPHSVHATMITSAENPKMVWCTLRDEYLVIPASDIVLAHGAMMPGEWTIMGILNAQPEFATPEPDRDVDQTPGFMQSVVGQVSKLIAPVVRVALGRPAAAHAITPLLIFREVA